MLAEELYDLIKFIEPPVLAYDATAVFRGVTEVLAEFPDLISVWVRRPMWAPFHEPFMQSETSFDLILEPGELAHALDHLPCRSHEILMKVSLIAYGARGDNRITTTLFKLFKILLK